MNLDDDRDVWVQLIAAVEYASTVNPPGLMIADAIEQALHQWINARLDATGVGADRLVAVPWDDPDPLRSTIEHLLDVVAPAGAVDGLVLNNVLSSAVENWVRRVADELNDGQIFTTSSILSRPVDLFSGRS